MGESVQGEGTGKGQHRAEEYLLLGTLSPSPVAGLDLGGCCSCRKEEGLRGACLHIPTLLGLPLPGPHLRSVGLWLLDLRGTAAVTEVRLLRVSVGWTHQKCQRGWAPAPLHRSQP